MDSVGQSVCPVYLGITVETMEILFGVVGRVDPRIFSGRVRMPQKGGEMLEKIAARWSRCSGLAT